MRAPAPSGGPKASRFAFDLCSPELDDLDPFGLAEQVVKDIFGGASGTVTALAAARVEVVSRATEIGIGFVWPGNVELARAN